MAKDPENRPTADEILSMDIVSEKNKVGNKIFLNNSGSAGGTISVRKMHWSMLQRS